MRNLLRSFLRFVFGWIIFNRMDKDASYPAIPAVLGSCGSLKRFYQPRLGVTEKYCLSRIDVQIYHALKSTCALHKKDIKILCAVQS